MQSKYSLRSKYSTKNVGIRINTFVRSKYSLRTKDVLISGSCSPAVSSKIGGYIQTIDPKLWGRRGRRFSWPVYHQANHGQSDIIFECLMWSLVVIVRLLKEARPRIIRPLVRRLAILYFDSCGRPECVAGVILCPGGQCQSLFFSTADISALSSFADPSLCEN